MKQAPSPDDMEECTQLEDISPSVVDGSPARVVWDQGRFTQETNGRSPRLLRPNVYVTPPYSPNHEAVLESFNDINNVLIDYAALENVRYSPQPARISQSQRLPAGEERIHRACLVDSAVSVALSVPIEAQSPNVFHEYLADNTRAVDEHLADNTREVDLLKDAVSFDFGNNTFQQTDRGTRDMFRSNLLGSAGITDEGIPHIYSCPNLLVHKKRLQHEDVISDDIVSPTGWSPLDPNRSSVLEGIDETELSHVRRRPRLNHQSDIYSKRVNTSDPCLPLTEQTAVKNTHIPLPTVVPDASGTNAEAGTHAPFQGYRSSTRSSLSETNGKVRSTHSKSHVVIVPIEDWTGQQERRESTSVLITSDYGKCLANGAKSDQAEHIELSSLSPSQRKRKFRRKRSIGLPTRSPTSKKRTGKTKQLCKKRTSGIRAHLAPFFRHAAPFRASELLSSYASLPRNKKAEKSHEITSVAPVAMHRASKLGAGVHAPPVENYSNNKLGASVPVCSEPNDKSSAVPIVQEPSSTSHWNRYYDPLADNRKCLRIRRRSSVDKVRGVVLDGGEVSVYFYSFASCDLCLSTAILR